VRVGFVGLGRMGRPMASRVHGAGFSVVGQDIAPEACEQVRAEGLEVADSIGGLSECEVVCCSLPDTPQVAEVCTGSGGLFDVLTSGSVVVDLSTISVSGSRQIAAQADAHGIGFLDAPVSGTSIHAEAGTLAIMVGGPVAVLERVEPVLASFSMHVERVGDNGAGLQLKLVSNRLITSYLTSIAEAVVALERTGLDVERSIEIIRAGAAPRQLDYKSDSLRTRDFTPKFTVDLMRKDLRLADEVLPPTRMAAVAHEILDHAEQAGFGDSDLASLITVVERYMEGP